MKPLKKVQIIVYKKNPLRFLVLRTSQSRSQRIWQGVTGGVEESDTSIREAALRELHEELGIDGVDAKLSPVIHEFTFITNRKGYQPGTTATEYCFGYEVPETYEVRLSHEHSEYRWLPFEDAEQLIDFEDPKLVIKYIYEHERTERATRTTN
jgi:dATP pyrophosphohydrolase